MKFFESKLLSQEEADQKLAQLEQDRTQLQQEQSLNHQKISALNNALHESEVDAILSGNADSGRRRDSANNEISALVRRNNDIDAKLRAAETARAVLESQKAAAIDRTKVAKFDDDSKALIALATELEPHLKAAGEILTKAVPIAQRLDSLAAWGYVSSPSTSWVTGVCASMAQNFDGAKITGLPSRTMFRTQCLADASLPKYLEDHLQRRREHVAKK